MNRKSLYWVALCALMMAGCQQPLQVIEQLPSPITPSDVPRPRPGERPQPPVETPRLSYLKDATIVIDAGHGGKDPGTRGVSPLPEKSIVLAIANEVAATLRQRGARVVTTRSDDRFIELDDRAATADRTRADLFVAIHADSSSRSVVSGATVYISRTASAESQRAAMSIEKSLRRAGIESRGINRAGFRVLVGHSRPAALIECGFLTNSQDARNLNTTAYRSRVAAAIVDGINDHFSR